MTVAFFPQQEYTKEVPALTALLVRWTCMFEPIRRKQMSGHDLIASLAAGILGAIGVLLPAVMAARSQRRKDEESRSESIAHQWADITKALKEQCAAMEAHMQGQMELLVERVRALEAENVELRSSMDILEEKNRTLTHGVRTLVSQIRRLGHEPDWDHTD